MLELEILAIIVVGHQFECCNANRIPTLLALGFSKGTKNIDMLMYFFSMKKKIKII
jgi:hypothetical protein